MRSRPWTAYSLRLLSCGLLFATGYVLLAGSTFAMRMREDMPSTLFAIVLAAMLSFVPLLFASRFLSVFLASAFLMSGIGGYWWTTIPWDEFVKDSGFPARTPPGILDYLLVASPPLIGAFYAITSRASHLMSDLKNRGADTHEIHRAAGTSFLSGAALLVLCTLFAGGLWALMATGVVFQAVAPIPTGVPALILVAALITVAYALIARRIPRFRPSRTPAPDTAERAIQTRVKPQRAEAMR